MTGDVQEVHIEQLLGRKVFDLNGEKVGRIEELHARRENDECLITEYMIGDYALMERFAAGTLVRTLLRKIPHSHESYCIPWECMDLTDADRPRLRCAKMELTRQDGA